MKGHAIIGFNNGALGLAETRARGTGFWSRNAEGVARCVLTEKAGPGPMIKTYNSNQINVYRTTVREIRQQPGGPFTDMD